MATDMIFEGFDKASDLALEDFFGERMAKAEALVACTYGEAGPAFRGMNDTFQDNFMWAVADMLLEANEARKELDRRQVERASADRKFIDIPVIGRAR